MKSFDNYPSSEQQNPDVETNGTDKTLDPIESSSTQNTLSRRKLFKLGGGIALGTAAAGSLLLAANTFERKQQERAEKVAFDEAVADALREALRVESADELYNSSIASVRLPADKDLPYLETTNGTSPYIILSIKTERTEFSKTGVFSDEGIEVGGRSVEITWQPNLKVEHSFDSNNGKTTLPGTIVSKQYVDQRQGKVDAIPPSTIVGDAEYRDYVVPFNVNGSNLTHMTREVTVSLATPIVRVGDKNTAGKINPAPADIVQLTVYVEKNGVKIISAKNKAGENVQIG